MMQSTQMGEHHVLTLASVFHYIRETADQLRNLMRKFYYVINAPVICVAEKSEKKEVLHRDYSVDCGGRHSASHRAVSQIALIHACCGLLFNYLLLDCQKTDVVHNY